MAEFCSCGSIIFNGNCSNKNCNIKPKANPETSKKTKAAKASGEAAKMEVKRVKTRRASKCITYNLYDIKKEEDT